MTGKSREQRAESRADVDRDDAPSQEATPRGRDYSFKNLLSWQKAQDLLLEILGAVKELPNDRVASILAQQVVRSASAIGANIAEGHGRYSSGAYRNHLSIARGSTTETISWLDVLRRAGYMSTEVEVRLAGTCEEIMSLLSAKMIQLDKLTRTDRSLRDERAEYTFD